MNPGFQNTSTPDQCEAKRTETLISSAASLSKGCGEREGFGSATSVEQVRLYRPLDGDDESSTCHRSRSSSSAEAPPDAHLGDRRGALHGDPDGDRHDTDRGTFDGHLDH
jgi:hypothetical protein